MKVCNICALVILTLLVVSYSQPVNARKRRMAEERTKDEEDDEEEQEDDNVHKAIASRINKHEYKKYSKEFSNEAEMTVGHNQNAKMKSGMKQKRLQLDLDNVNEDELTSDELRVLQYRRRKLERQTKKTLGDVFEEKKQRKEKRKQKFKKNVLKHFKTSKEQDEDVLSCEEVITPLKRTQLTVKDVDDCNSSEENCP